MGIDLQNREVCEQHLPPAPTVFDFWAAAGCQCAQIQGILPVSSSLDR